MAQLRACVVCVGGGEGGVGGEGVQGQESEARGPPSARRGRAATRAAGRTRPAYCCRPPTDLWLTPTATSTQWEEGSRVLACPYALEEPQHVIRPLLCSTHACPALVAETRMKSLPPGTPIFTPALPQHTTRLQAGPRVCRGGSSGGGTRTWTPQAAALPARVLVRGSCHPGRPPPPPPPPRTRRALLPPGSSPARPPPAPTHPPLVPRTLLLLLGCRVGETRGHRGRKSQSSVCIAPRPPEPPQPPHQPAAAAAPPYGAASGLGRCLMTVATRPARGRSRVRRRAPDALPAVRSARPSAVAQVPRARV